MLKTNVVFKVRVPEVVLVARGLEEPKGIVSCILNFHGNLNADGHNMWRDNAKNANLITKSWQTLFIQYLQKINARLQIFHVNPRFHLTSIG